MSAVGALWERHHRAGLAAARSIAPILDADDLVSESFLKIIDRVVDGSGPTGAFRPYFYRVIKSVAADTFRSPTLTSDQLDAVPELSESGPWEDGAFDRNAALEAFSGLNERWQSVLWYTEVEGMAPREVAKLTGLTANSVSALAVRARDALRSGWVEAHLKRELEGSECLSTKQNLQRYKRGKLTAAASRDVAAHLDVCENCTAAAEELAMLNSQLALVLTTLFVGGGTALALLHGLGSDATISASAASVLPSPPPASGTPGHGGSEAGSSAGATAGAGASTGSMIAIVSGAVLAAAAVIAGGVLVVSNLVAPPVPETTTVTEPTHIEAPRHPDSAVSEAAEPQQNTDAATAVREERTSSSLGASSSAVSREVPSPPLPLDPLAPPLPPVVTPPIMPTPALDFMCYASGGAMFSGYSTEYGVIRARVTPPNSTPVEVVQPQFDPSNAGQPGNFFDADGTFSDPYGNTFDFGFFSGTDPEAPWFWTAPQLSPLSQWTPDLDGVDFTASRIEFMLVTPDGRQSVWNVIKEHDASLAFC